LNVGKVRTYGSMAYFTVSANPEIKVILEIFSETPLNTTKHLNFLSFKKAFELYMNINSHNKLEINSEIDILMNSMNNKRKDYTMVKPHNIRITPY
jgi:hypothetical protein